MSNELTDAKRHQIKERLKNVQSLPTIPPIVAKLNKMVEDEDMTATRLGVVIERDQVLTSKILKMVNSSFFGFPQRISTVSNALVLLGFNVIKTLIVTSSIFEVMQASDVGLWEHSLGCALISSIIAKKKGIKNPEEISTAGLIHDLGKVVIRAELPDDFQNILEYTHKHGVSVSEAEEKLLGIMHPEIGAWLAKQWNLPPRLVVPIRFHHQPEQAPEFKDVCAIIHFSNILIRGLGFGYAGDPWVPSLEHNAWEKVKLGKQEMKELLDELELKLLELKDFTADFAKNSKKET